MKTYTDKSSGEQFMAGLYPGTGRAMLLRFQGFKPDDKPHDVVVPAHLSGRAMCAIRRSDANRLLTVAEECIDINAGFDPAYSVAAE